MKKIPPGRLAYGLATKPPKERTPPPALEQLRFEQLKGRLLQEALRTAVDIAYYASLQRAANEAASLAWTTDHPLLFFPALFEEKAEAAQKRASKQNRVRYQTSGLFSRAV